MAITWNSIKLKVLVSSDWNPGTPSVTLTETPLLPNKDDLSAVASVLQQGPTLRNRASGKCYVSTMTEYDTLANHWKTGTTGTLDDDDTLNATYAIERLGPPRKVQDNYVDFDITFVEV